MKESSKLLIVFVILTAIGLAVFWWSGGAEAVLSICINVLIAIPLEIARRREEEKRTIDRTLQLLEEELRKGLLFRS